ncbi:hypothetical protein A2963_04440 [Candidatus Roizmanbacteria bacterium RIFCSPLOWO2_01_FULL_40_13]|nr:MAG: hypothetical protein A2963_04440 [Candidatus Roizmanbacteria bacterium RIFCSPLOWO2_01_FULL_40_13]
MPPIEASRAYLPTDPSLLKVFDEVWPIHPAINQVTEYKQVRKMDDSDLTPPIVHLLSVAGAHLANRGADEYLKEVGEMLWTGLESLKAVAFMTSNTSETMKILGFPAVQFMQFRHTTIPQVGFKGSLTNREDLSAYVFINPEFIIDAKTNPIQTLGNIAYIGSQVRDLINGRIIGDERMVYFRALATEAHFLLHALKDHPETKLNQNSKEIIKAFPNGLASLPTEAIYPSKARPMSPHGSQLN